MSAHIDEMNRLAGERFTEALVQLKERAKRQVLLGERKDATLTPDEQYRAAWYACLNRAERRRLRRRK